MVVVKLLEIISKLLNSKQMTIKSKQIIFLVTNISSYGGIQSYMKKILFFIDKREDKSLPIKKRSLISLNDNDEEFRKNKFKNLENFYACNSSKFKFILNSTKHLNKENIFIVGHLNLAPVAYFFKKFRLIDSYIVILHGIECWEKISFLRRISLRNAKKNIATTNFTIEKCSKNNNISKSKFSLIPLSVRNKKNIKIKHDRSKNFNLLFVGRLEENENYKGLELLIEASKNLVNKGIKIKLNIVGEGNAKQKFISIANLKSNRYIKFLGQISNQDLKKLYLSSDLFVMPSFGEGFGIVFLEAMSYGIPCIGGNYGGTPEVIRDGIDGFLISKKDEKLLQNKIEILYQNFALYEKFSNSSINIVESNFSDEIFFSRWNNLFDSLKY